MGNRILVETTADWLLDTYNTSELISLAGRGAPHGPDRAHFYRLAALEGDLSLSPLEVKDFKAALMTASQIMQVDYASTPDLRARLQEWFDSLPVPQAIDWTPIPDSKGQYCVYRGVNLTLVEFNGTYRATASFRGNNLFRWVHARGMETKARLHAEDMVDVALNDLWNF